MVCRTGKTQSSQACSIIMAPVPGGVFVVHAGGSLPILLVGWCRRERRSLVVSADRALGIIQQLALAAANDQPLRLWDDRADELGLVPPRHALTLIADLASAVREIRAAAQRGGA